MEEDDAGEMLSGLEAVLSGQSQRFRLDYPCHGPEERRWFRVTVTPLQSEHGGGAVVSHDSITEQVLAERERARQEQQLESVFDLAPVGIGLMDASSGEIGDVNRAFLDLVGYSREEVIGRSTVDLGLWPDADLRERMKRELAEPGDVIRDRQVQFRSRGGAVRHVLLSARRLELDGDEYYLWTNHNITSLVEASWNRWAPTTAWSASWRRWRSRSPSSIRTGGSCSPTRRRRSSSSSPRPRWRSGIRRVLGRVRGEFRARFTVGDEEFRLATSTGAHFFRPEEAEDEDSSADAAELIRYADIAMFHAKDTGDDEAAFFTPESGEARMRLLQREQELERAIGEGEIVPFYQPLLDLRSGSVVGIETVARWQHPERGLVSPADFIPLAEESGLIVPLGEAVFEQACRDLRGLDESNPGRRLRLFVNFSARELSSSSRVDHVREILGESLGVETIAEGIETERQEDTVRQFGVQIGQGFRYAKPRPAADLDASLRSAAEIIR